MPTSNFGRFQASVRTAYRCEKQPTGGLNRDSLINYINEEGINAPDKEEKVPFELGKKRGKGWMIMGSSVDFS